MQREFLGVKVAKCEHCLQCTRWTKERFFCRTKSIDSRLIIDLGWQHRLDGDRQFLLALMVPWELLFSVLLLEHSMLVFWAYLPIFLNVYFVVLWGVALNFGGALDQIVYLLHIYILFRWLIDSNNNETLSLAAPALALFGGRVCGLSPHKRDCSPVCQTIGTADAKSSLLLRRKCGFETTNFGALLVFFVQ